MEIARWTADRTPRLGGLDVFSPRAPPARNACASSGSVDDSADVRLKAAGTAVARDGRVLVMKKRRAPLAGRGSPWGEPHNGSNAYRPLHQLALEPPEPATRSGACTTTSPGACTSRARPGACTTSWPRHHLGQPAAEPPRSRNAFMSSASRKPCAPRCPLSQGAPRRSAAAAGLTERARERRRRATGIPDDVATGRGFVRWRAACALARGGRPAVAARRGADSRDDEQHGRGAGSQDEEQHRGGRALTVKLCLISRRRTTSLSDPRARLRAAHGDDVTRRWRTTERWRDMETSRPWTRSFGRR